MRIALLSTLERITDGSPRALLSLGGRPLIAWQMDLAKALGCERLLCLTEGAEEVSEQLREVASSVGLPLELIGGPRHLVGKVTADQEVVVLADGLVVAPEIAIRHFATARGVAALSDYPAVEAGFERIDPEHAWAGLLVARGAIVEQLAAMPADSDTISLLLRTALQAGTRLVRLDDMHIGSGEILIAKGRDAIQGREKAMLDHSTTLNSWISPSEAIASRLARRMAPDALKSGPLTALALGIGLLASGLLGAYFDYALVALATLLTGSFAISLAAALRRLRARLHGKPDSHKLRIGINGLVDASVIATLALLSDERGLLPALFGPILLVGLWRLSAALVPRRFAPFWHDRALLIGLLLGLTAFDLVTAVLPFAVLALLGICLISEASSRLTRV